MNTNAFKLMLKFVLGLLLQFTFAVQAADNPHTLSATSKSADCLSCHVAKPEHDLAKPLETKNK